MELLKLDQFPWHLHDKLSDSYARAKGIEHYSYNAIRREIRKKQASDFIRFTRELEYYVPSFKIKFI